jgi:hypothetical protein
MEQTLPALQRKTGPFVGTEAEGPHQGDPVIFVPGTVNLDIYYLHVKPQLHQMKGVYYGAGNCRNISPAVFTAIADDCKLRSLHLVVEVDQFWHWLRWKRDQYDFLVVYFDNLGHLGTVRGYADYHKTIKDGKITWTKVDDPRTVYITPIDCPLFAQDQDLIVSGA